MKAPSLADNRGLAVLMGLGALGKHVYGGTVPDAGKRRRRTKAKAARRVRRITRSAR